MQKQPQIFQELGNQSPNTKLSLFQLFIKNLSQVVNQICIHRVSFNINNNKLQINQNQCELENNQQNFFVSILNILFALLQNDTNLTNLNLENNNQINLQYNLVNADLGCFKRNVSRYQVFENQSEEAQRLISLETFALNNNFQNQISYTVIKLQNCCLKLYNEVNGDIIPNSFPFIHQGFLRLLEFFIQAQRQNLILKPVCIHQVNLGLLFQDQNRRATQFLQTSQQDCGVCGNLGIAKSFGLLVREILLLDENTCTQYQSELNLAERIAQGQITSLKLILELFDETFVDHITEIDLLNVDYQPIPRRTIQNVNDYLDLEIQHYKKYFINKTISLLSNLIYNYINNQIDIQNVNYQQFLNLLNSVEQIYLTINSANQNIVQPQYEDYQNLINQNQQFIENGVNVSFQSIKFRIICCFYSDRFFSLINMRNIMESYLNFTNYRFGIQFRHFENFLDDNTNNEQHQNVLREMQRSILHT